MGVFGGELERVEDGAADGVDVGEGVAEPGFGLGHGTSWLVDAFLLHDDLRGGGKEYRGLSTTLRCGRDDGLGFEKQIPQGNDRKKGKSKMQRPPGWAAFVAEAESYWRSEAASY